MKAAPFIKTPFENADSEKEIIIKKNKNKKYIKYY